MSIKQVIVLRKDLNMRKGKMVAQGAHASMAAILDEMQITGNDQNIRYELDMNVHNDIAKWLEGSFTKICVSVDSEEELRDIWFRAHCIHMPCSIITDNGLTEFNGVKTVTAVAIGPADSGLIDEITGGLPLL